ncbi:MAG: DNA-3-methyladenine glycosylase [Candidatus Acidiferrales bacterium]
MPVDTVELAQFLIGKLLVRELSGGRRIGRIVETEAYPPGDSSGHAFRGQTASNRSLFFEHGRAYVHFSYGTSILLNVTSEAAGTGASVLLRALEPLAGIRKMMRSRGTSRIVDLARGPGRITIAMRVDKRFDGADLCARGPLWLGTDSQQLMTIGATVRIGISREMNRKLRFYVCGSPFVSGPKKLPA